MLIKKTFIINNNIQQLNFLCFPSFQTYSFNNLFLQGFYLIFIQYDAGCCTIYGGNCISISKVNSINHITIFIKYSENVQIISLLKKFVLDRSAYFFEILFVFDARNYFTICRFQKCSFSLNLNSPRRPLYYVMAFNELSL